MPNKNWLCVHLSLAAAETSSGVKKTFNFYIKLIQRENISDQQFFLLNEHLIKGSRFIVKTLSKYSLEQIKKALCRFCLSLPEEIFKVKMFSKVVLFEICHLKKIKKLGEFLSEDILISEDPSCSFGKVSIVFECDQFGVYYLKLSPKKSIPLHIHKYIEEKEMIFSDFIMINGKLEPFGTSFSWKKNQPHTYENPFLEEKIVLCIDQPKFNPLDEILVSDINNLKKNFS